MADLTYTQLLAQLPNSSITVAADVLSINVNLVTGESTLALSDQKVTEFISKLLKAAEAAQSAYNTANPNAQLNTYPNSNLGIPVADDNGDLFATRTHTVTVAIPLDEDEIIANAL